MSDAIDLAHKRRLAESDKAQDARLVTPKDILIDLVNQIDKGEIDPDKMVVCWCNMEKDKAGWSLANMNRLEVLGLVSEFTYYYNRDV